MTGILHYGSRRCILQKAAELNKFSVPEWSIWAQCFWLRFYVLRVNMVIGFCGDHCFDFLYTYDFRDIYSSKKKPMPKDHIELLVIRFTCILHSCCYCLYMLYTKTSTSGWGVVIMLLNSGLLFS
jgi:APA family basic amino acid/polyamine antiporter